MAEVLGVISSIIAILELGGVVIDCVHKTKSASADSERLLLEISSINGFLASLKELISRAESQDLWLDTVKSLGTPQGPIAQYDSALKRLEVKLKPAVSWKKAGKALRWPFEKAEVTEILGSIERQKALFALALGNDHIRLSIALQADVADIKRDLSLLQFGVNELGTNSQDQYMAIIYAWLDPLSGDFEKKQADVFNLKGRQDGVCKWLLKTTEFVEWISGTRTHLWCSGAPGIGKTVISSFVIDHLYQDFANDKDVAVVFLYCNYKDSDRQTTRNMMASVLHQLSLQAPPTAKHLEAMYEKHKHRGSQPSLPEILVALRSISTYFKSIFVVVDALDEYASNALDELLEGIQMLSPQASCFLTSRPNIHVNMNDMIHLTIRAHVVDIEGYLASSIAHSSTLANLVRKEPTLKTQIVETVVEKANGMFLLARLHIQPLQTKTNLRKLKLALSKLPEEQDQAYKDLIERIRNQNADYAGLAMKALLWIVNAKRPLKMEELIYALAVEPSDTSLDTDGVSDSSLVLSVCAGIVMFEPESRIVGLVHYTAQEYLARRGQDIFPDAQQEMALICLTALSFQAARNHYYEEETHQQNVHLQLSRYAVPYWADHMRDSLDESACQELALDFVCFQGKAMETVRLQGAGILNLLELQRSSYATTGLCVLAALGLNSAMTRLLNEDPRLRPSNSISMHCALLFAVFHGRTRTAALLIEQGANVDYRSGDTETALHYAASKNDEATMKLLLDHDATVDAVANVRPYHAQHLHPCQSHREWTVLHFAASLGHSGIVQLLLRRGAQIGRADSCGHTALHLAVAANAFDVVRFLLKLYPNPLQMVDGPTSPIAHADASANGTAQISRAVSINARNDMKQTALHLAAFFRSERVVPLLIVAGADLDARDSFDNTPLLVATHGRDVKKAIVEALLEAGADVNAAGQINGDTRNTALHLAIEPSKSELLQLLLRNGAIANSRNKTGSTPMHLATWLGSGIGTYRLLLYAGVDVNAQDFHGNTALHLLVVADDISVIRYFLEHGAKVGVKNQQGKTAGDVAKQWRATNPCVSSSVVSLLKNAENDSDVAVSTVSPSSLVLRPR